MMTLTFSADRDIYTRGEDILVTTLFKNHSTSPVEIADFSVTNDTRFQFEVTYPNKTKALFTFFEPASAKVITGSTISVDANQQYLAGLSIPSVADINMTGQYSIVATLNVNGVNITSQPFSFELVRVKASSPSIAVGLKMTGSATNGEGAYVQRSNESNTIYRYQFYETMHVGEVATRALVPLFTTTDPVIELIVPENSSNVTGELSRWLVWRGDNTVNAMIDTSSAPVTWTAPVSLGGIIPSVTKIFDGPLEILAVSESSDKLWLLRAQGGFGVPQNSITEKWEVQLDIPSSALLAAVPPQGVAGKHHLLAIEEQEQGYLLHRALYDEKSLGKFSSSEIMKGSYFPKVPIAIKADENNNLLAASFYTKQTEKDVKLVLLLVRFDLDGKTRILRNEIIEGATQDQIETGVFSWSRLGSKVERLDLVVKSFGGDLWKLQGTNLVPVAVPGNTTSPIQLFSASESTYILYQSENQGFYFEAI